MAVRSDITVDFGVSPRIVTVPKDGASSTSVTIQDLHDTLRTIEAYPWNMDELRLIDSYGKQDLGNNVAVGITSVLRNAKLAFEARDGPSYIACTVSGGNLVAINDIGVPMSPIQPTSFTQVTLMQSTSATLINDLSKGDVTNAVWDEATITERTTIGSLGKRIIDVLKLKRTRP